MTPLARDLARLLNDLDSVSRRFKNQIMRLNHMEIELRALDRQVKMFFDGGEIGESDILSASGSEELSKIEGPLAQTEHPVEPGAGRDTQVTKHSRHSKNQPGAGR